MVIWKKPSRIRRIKYVKFYESLFGNRLKDGTIPISTIKGGLIFIDNQLSIKAILTEENGLIDNQIMNTFQDRNGDVWGASVGLFRVDFDTTLTYLSPKNKLRGLVVDVLRHRMGHSIKGLLKIYLLSYPKTNIFEQSQFVGNKAQWCLEIQRQFYLLTIKSLQRIIIQLKLQKMEKQK